MVKKQIRLASIPENITIVESLIEEVQTDFQIGDEQFGNMLIAITEAVNNAILHGNSGDQSKYVDINVKVSEKAVIFFISDEGAGFDYNNLPDPTAPENLEKPSGRGVFLIKHLANLVIFSDSGSSVEIQFHR